MSVRNAWSSHPLAAPRRAPVHESLTMCKNASWSTRLSVGGMALGFLLQIIGVSMPHWCDSTELQTKRSNFGLWKSCEDIGRPGEHVPICQFSLNAQIISVQILGVLGVLGTVATPCLVLAAILKVEDKCRTSVLSILSALGTASFIIIGVTVFGLEVPDENWRLSWAFGLSATAGVVYVGVFVTLTWTAIRRRSAPSSVAD